MGIKLICIDMDGTLLGKDKQTVSKDDKETIKDAISRGIHVAITTGRVYDCAKIYAETIGLKTPIVSSNGAYIGGSDGQEIYSNYLSGEDLKDFYKITEKYNLQTYLTTNIAIVSTAEIEEDHIYKVFNKTIAEDKRIKFDVVSDISEALQKYEGKILKGLCLEKKDVEKLKKARKELEQCGDNLEIVTSWVDNFEVMKKGSSKGEAVKMLTKYFDLTCDEVMCIGDSENDISMIKFAKIGVAMGNATEDVKEAADYVTDDNCNGGVGKAIRKYVLGEK